MVGDDLGWLDGGEESDCLILFLNPIGSFSWLFPSRVAVDGSGSQLGCIEGTLSSTSEPHRVASMMDFRQRAPPLPYFFLASFLCSSSHSSFFFNLQVPLLHRFVVKYL